MFFRSLGFFVLEVPKSQDSLVKNHSGNLLTKAMMLHGIIFAQEQSSFQDGCPGNHNTCPNHEQNSFKV
jgi:hypothetical protein